MGHCAETYDALIHRFYYISKKTVIQENLQKIKKEEQLCKMKMAHSEFILRQRI